MKPVTMLVALLTVANLVLVAMAQSGAVCIGNGAVNRRTIQGYVQVVREATNSTLAVNESPVSGLQQQFPPYSKAYKAAFNYKLTKQPEYSSDTLGFLEGSFSVPAPGTLTITGDIKLNTDTGYTAFQGRLDSSKIINQAPITGGVNETYYSLGTLTTKLVRKYENNEVRSFLALLYIFKLC